MKVETVSAKWDHRFLEIAMQASGWSKDQSTRVGAVLVDNDRIVRCIGYNGIPRSVEDDVPERHERPHKYHWFNHAEMNLLSNCARIGMKTEGCTIYVSHHPCACCTRNLIQSGIQRVVCYSHANDFEARWTEELTVSKEMFLEAGVTLDLYELPK